MSYLFKAMYNELEGLLGDTEYATLENAHVMANSHPSDVNKYDRQDIKVMEGGDESKVTTVSGLIEVSDCARADSIVSSSNILIVLVGESEFSEKLVVKREGNWGLVVCHHFSSRFVPYPLRHACEVLIQIFGVQMNKEVDLAAQMRDIAGWLLESYGGSNGLSIDSLMEAGYSHATVLSDVACEVAIVKITSTDFLFWFLLILSGSLQDDVADDSNMILNLDLLEKENDGSSFADIDADDAGEVEESLDGDYDASVIDKIFEDESGELKEMKHGERGSGKTYGNRGGRSGDQGGLVKKGAGRWMERRGFVVTDDGDMEEKHATSVLTEWVTVPLAGRMKARKVSDIGWLVSI